MELTELWKDCKKQIWSWGRSGAQFWNLEYKSNHNTSQIKPFFDSRIKFKHLSTVYKVLNDVNLVYIFGLHHSPLAYKIICNFPSNIVFYTLFALIGVNFLPSSTFLRCRWNIIPSVKLSPLPSGKANQFLFPAPITLWSYVYHSTYFIIWVSH